MAEIPILTIRADVQGFTDIQNSAQKTADSIQKSTEQIQSTFEVLDGLQLSFIERLKQGEAIYSTFANSAVKNTEKVIENNKELLDKEQRPLVIPPIPPVMMEEFNNIDVGKIKNDFKGLVDFIREALGFLEHFRELFNFIVQHRKELVEALKFIGFLAGALAIAVPLLPAELLIGVFAALSLTILAATGHLQTFAIGTVDGFEAILDMIRPTDEQLQNIVDNMVEGARDIDSAFDNIEFGNVPNSAFDKIKSLGDIFPDLKEQPFVPQIDFIQLPDDQQLNDFLNNEKEINDELERGNGLIEEQSSNFSIYDGAIAMANGGLVAGAGAHSAYTLEVKNTNEQVEDLGVGLQGAGGAAEDFSDSLQQVENSGGFFQGIKDGFKQFAESVGSSTELIADFFANTLSQMSQNFSDLFFNVITGKFDDLKDLAKQAFEAILKSFLDLVSAIATKQIVISIAGLFGVDTKGAKATDLLGGAGDLGIVEEVNEISTQTKIEQIEEGYRLAA